MPKHQSLRFFRFFPNFPKLTAKNGTKLGNYPIKLFVEFYSIFLIFKRLQEISCKIVSADRKLTPIKTTRTFMTLNFVDISNLALSVWTRLTSENISKLFKKIILDVTRCLLIRINKFSRSFMKTTYLEHTIKKVRISKICSLQFYGRLKWCIIPPILIQDFLTNPEIWHWKWTRKWENY